MDFLGLLIDRLEKDSTLIGMPLTKFAREVLQYRPWKGQREINRLVEEGHRRIFIGTGHGIGKTSNMAVVVCWAMATWLPRPTVITTAPTGRQVRDLLWREIRNLWNSSPELSAMGTCLVQRLDLGDKWFALGFSTDDPVRLQGIHNQRLLFVIDEANGFPESLWEAIDTCVTNNDAQIVAIGNCIVPYGTFYRGFSSDKVATLKISAREHPNVRRDKELIPGAVTKQWIEDFEDKYKSTPQIVKARIDAVFPSTSNYGLISSDLLQTAKQRQAKTEWPVILSCDVSRFGDNKTVLAKLKGQRLVSFTVWQHQRLTETAKRIRVEFEREGQFVVIDDDGLGGGVTDILHEWGIPVVPFHNGGKPDNEEKFVDAISEAYFLVKESLENGSLCFSIDDDELDMQLISRDYSITSSSKIKLEAKEKYINRTGLSSPDKADSLAMGWQVVNRVWNMRIRATAG